MQSAEPNPESRFTILCLRCDRPVFVRGIWVGREVQCPHCSSVIRVPEQPTIDIPVRSDAPNLAPKRQFNFACPRCDCLLEAHTGMCGQQATCPTCAARLAIPFIKKGSSLPHATRLIDAPAETPTPLHAYAASGHQAPSFVQGPGGATAIECPRCNAHSPIDADACIACAAPFTLEAAPTMGKIRLSKYGAASLTLGIVSLFTFMVFAPAILAIGLGALTAVGAGSTRRLVQGLAGAACGIVSIAAGLLYWLYL